MVVVIERVTCMSIQNICVSSNSDETKVQFPETGCTGNTTPNLRVVIFGYFNNLSSE